MKHLDICGLVAVALPQKTTKLFPALLLGSHALRGIENLGPPLRG